MEKLRITGDGILVTEPEKPSEQHVSGLFVPPSSQSSLTEVLVVAVGPGVMLDNGMRADVGVKAGERVLVNRQGGIPIERNGRAFRLIRPQEVVAVIENGDA